MKNPKITFFPLVCFFVITTSFASVSLLMLNKFNPLYSILFGAISLFLFSLLNQKNISLKTKNLDKIILAILIVAFLFRLNTFPWILGGQDQGLYTNMSAYYQRYGSNFPIDHLRQNLTSQEKILYDQQMHFSMDEKKQSHNLSIDFYNLDKSQYVFSFYPLHPLWMANFGSVFGFDNRFLSLTFFSLLSIYSIYLLTYKISQNKKAAYLSSSLIAISPLHVFFSRFPVTEILSIFFSTSAIYFFINYYESLKESQKDNLSLFLSIGLLFCLFFNHAGGFLYLPLLLLLFFIVSPKLNKKLILFYFAFILVFALSNFYGYKYSGNNLILVYQGILSRIPILFGNQITNLLILSSIFLIIFLPLYFIVNFRQKVISFISNKKFIPIIFALLFTLLFSKIYNLITVVDPQKEYLGLGLKSISYSSFYTYIIYLSPFAFIFLLIYLFNVENNYVKFLFALLFNFFIVRTYLMSTTPYQYYYARYLLSELIPYSIILISVFLAELLNNKKKKELAITIILFISIPYLLYSLSLFKGTELSKAQKSLDNLTQYLGKNDVLLYGIYYFPSKIPTALQYYYDKNMLLTTDYQKTLKEFNETLSTKYGNVFILYPIEIKDDPNLIPVKIIKFTFDEFEHSNKIPEKFIENDFYFYLYKVIDKNMYNESNYEKN